MMLLFYTSQEVYTNYGTVSETAKRNGLDPFGYLMFLLQELPKLGPDPAEEQLLPLLPWSPDLPGYCKIKQ